MRNSCISYSFLLVHKNVNYGQVLPINRPADSSINTLKQKEVRLGVQLKGMYPVSTLVGAFIGYKWNRSFGIDSGLFYRMVMGYPYRGPSLDYLIIPIVGTYYPNCRGLAANLYCLFYGVEFGYLVGQVNVPPDINKLAKVQLGLTVGLNCEFSWGYMFGFNYTRYLIDPVAKGQPRDNWCLHGSWALEVMLGINFVKLIDKVYHLFD